MSQIKYYLVTGERVKPVRAVWTRYHKVARARKKFSKQHGGTGVVFWRPDKWGIVSSTEPQDPEWRKDSGSGHWLPRARTSLAREMSGPQYIQVTPEELCDAIGVEYFNGKTCTWSTPGIEQSRKTKALIVLLADWQKPPKDLVRISDLEYEKLIKKPKKARK